MHAMSVDGEVEAFVELGTLIVEGRVPCPGTPRGYREGSHCPGTTQRTRKRHYCDTQNSFLCKRVEKLRKHMALLCANALPMCVEVLLCADCQCGRDKAWSSDIGVIPSPTDLLLEQWTVSIVRNSSSPAPMTIHGLFQAVRSQLHFSQLSAWWSNSRGVSPQNVCYRLTLPGQAFSSQFSRQPLEHSFPLASVTNNIDIKVSVSTLPRSDSILVITCPLHSAQAEPPVRKRSITSSSEQQLLGESLLDPPDRMASSTNLQASCSWRGTLQRIPRQNTSHSTSEFMSGNSSSSTLLDRAQSNNSAHIQPVIPIMLPGLVDDRMQTGCERTGKHRCSCGEEELDCPTIVGPGPRYRRRSQVTPAIHPTAGGVLNNDTSEHSLDLPSSSSSSSSSPSSSASSGKKLHFELSQREVEEVLTVLRTRTPCGIQQTPNKFEGSHHVNNSNNSDLVGMVNHMPCTIQKQTPRLPGSDPMIVAFAAEEKNTMPAKSDLLLSAILRTSKNLEMCSSRSKFEEENDTDILKPFNDLSFDNKKPCVNSKKISPLFLSDSFRTSNSTDTVFKISGSSSSSSSSQNNNNHNIDGNNDLWSGFRTNDVVDRTKSALCSIVDRFRTRQCVKKRSTVDENGEKVQDEDVQVGSEDVKEYDLDLNQKQQNSETSSSRIVPTALDKAKFRRSLDSAASMVFHWRTGLPLTSSPAPLRRASHRFDFDSSINCVSAIRSALYDPSDRLSASSDDTESDKSPSSPSCLFQEQHYPTWPHHLQLPSSSLLGSFEESVLNGRLEPVSTVHGFTADLSASGSFCPRHLVLPVTVFFYTLGDNDKVSTPYMGHINLGKKGYTVPRSGTIQVTLLNPLGTVIKMFVVMYDLSDMPHNSCTFLRQRTLYMPSNTDKEPKENAQKYLRYLIHLRFTSSKSGRISLHTDIRMIIFRKSDLDTATGLAQGMDTAHELRSFTRGPVNPKFSPRK